MNSQLQLALCLSARSCFTLLVGKPPALRQPVGVEERGHGDYAYPKHIRHPYFRARISMPSLLLDEQIALSFDWKPCMHS